MVPAISLNHHQKREQPRITCAQGRSKTITNDEKSSCEDGFEWNKVLMGTRAATNSWFILSGLLDTQSPFLIDVYEAQGFESLSPLKTPTFKV
jgi:hypothetical protein